MPVKLLFILLINWIFKSVSSYDVFCESFEGYRSNFETKQYYPKKTIYKVKVIECYLGEMSEFSFHHIGRNLSEFYKFHENKGESSSGNQTNLLPVEMSFVNAEWQMMPSGFDLIFHRVMSLNITNCGLAILDKQNMKQFGENLKAANFSGNLLMFITEDIFIFNKYLRYCDFSDNPIVYIADFFFDAQVLVENSLTFYFKNVKCVDKTEIDKLYASENYLKPINCTNSEKIVSYNDLEFVLEKQPYGENELSCSVVSSCSLTTIYNKGKPSSEKWRMTKQYLCNITVTNPRTVVSKMKLSDNQSPDYCDDLETIHRVDIFFTRINKLEYIAYKLANVFPRKPSSINIVRCKLGTISEFDMQQFGSDLEEVDFTSNNLKMIGKNVFRHNTNLIKVVLEGNPILYIDSKFIFRNVYKEGDFYLGKSPYRCGKNL